MKIIALWAGVTAASAANVNTKGSKLSMDADGCDAYVAKFLKEPVTKSTAIELAMDYCAVNKLVNDENFVCPRFRSVLDGAFARESTTKKFDAKSFCGITETYVSDLASAAKIPNMGKGSLKDFEVSEKCKPTALGSFGGKDTLASSKVPDFWFAMCMNQDCGSFLPSRTRWCTKDHQPTHSASVCEAVRGFARSDISNKFPAEMKPAEVCKVYDDFVEDTHLDIDAYNHVVHAEEHKVPSPDDKKRALDSAAMKHEAGEHKIRDSQASPVESAAATQVPMVLVALVGLWAGRS